ncbi:MAG: VWA domain-containing protein [Acidobacteriota bacterium]
MHWTRVVLLAAAAVLPAADDEVVFRSDVSLVRIDVQVQDRNKDAITGLNREDFVLREEGRVQEIRNFASENVPVDILMLLDVSGSMRPHLEQVARASRRALQVLGKEDRVGVMVFDRATRVRQPFRANPDDAVHELDFLLRQETFDGGTDITRALLDAANYVELHARPDARRAIVIVTDDRTEFDRDEPRVNRALASADAVLSLLLAPAIDPGYGRGGGGGMPGGRQYPPSRRRGGGSWPGGGSTWPGGGGSTWPGGGGGSTWPIPGGQGPVWGPGGGGGGRIPGGGQYPGQSRTKSAGTDEIARDSGGDSLSLGEASSVERTLQRIRNRYAIYFLLPNDAHEGEQRNVDVILSSAAASRYAGAEVRMRRRYLVPKLGPRSTPSETTVTSTAEPESTGGFRRATPSDVVPASDDTSSANKRRRAAISEPGATRGPNPSLGSTPKP